MNGNDLAILKYTKFIALNIRKLREIHIVFCVFFWIEHLMQLFNSSERFKCFSMHFSSIYDENGTKIKQFSFYKLAG
jgi:hypothetical protein